MWFSSDLAPDFNGFLDSPTPQNIEKCMGGPSKINKLEFSHMIMKVTEKTFQIGSKIIPKSTQIVTQTWLRNTLKTCHKINTENTDFGPQNGLLFWRFLLPKSTPKQPWNQLRTWTKKTPGNDPKNQTKFIKIGAWTSKINGMSTLSQKASSQT